MTPLGGSLAKILSPVEARVPDTEGFKARAASVAKIAAAYAENVDREARFPQEAVDAMKAERLLGLLVPMPLGGEEGRISDAAEICYRLGQVCASAAMIYAMHQSCMACILDHAGDSAWHRELLRRAASEQLLFASSTTEGQGGGNVRVSSAAIERTASEIRLERAATVISYGAQADGIVTTARRAASAAASDQVLVVFTRDDYELEPLSSWDTLGMRGTCSSGFNLKASGCADQIMPVSYESIHAQSMVPVSHLVWSAAWTGIAAGAVERARAFVRRAARASAGTQPPGAAHLTKALAALQTLRGRIAAALTEYERKAGDARALMAIDFQAAVTLLKVEASEASVAIVLEAGRACGLAGYRNDSEFSIGRSLRDILSAPIMINNDRILANLAMTSLLTPVPGSITA